MAWETVVVFAKSLIKSTQATKQLLGDCRGRVEAMSEWRVQILNQEFGPMGFEDVRDLAARGTLAPTDYVRHGDEVWQQAERLDGLFTVPLVCRQDGSGPASVSIHARETSKVIFGWKSVVVLTVCVAVLMLQCFPTLFVRLLQFADVRTWSLMEFVVADALILGMLTASRFIDALLVD